MHEKSLPCDESSHNAKHKIWDKTRFHLVFHPILIFFLASLSQLFFVTSTILPKPKVFILCLTYFMDNFNKSKLKATNWQVLFVFIKKMKQFCDVATLEFIHKRNYPNLGIGRSERKVEKIEELCSTFQQPVGTYCLSFANFSPPQNLTTLAHAFHKKILSMSCTGFD
jgi:hypothetical protein